MRGMIPILLAIDTSTRSVGIALYDGVQVISEYTWSSQDHHTAELAPAVASVLQRSHLTIQNLVAIGVATGPGSFTGLRIGLALAKGIALVQRIPLIGIPTLDILAAQSSELLFRNYGSSSAWLVAESLRTMPLAAVLRAGRGRLAVGWYQAAAESATDGTFDAASPDTAVLLNKTRWLPSRAVEVLTAQDLSQRINSPTLVCGELSEEERRLLARKRKNVILATPAASTRRPAFLAELAWERYQVGQFDDPAALSPLYLHYNDPIPE